MKTLMSTARHNATQGYRGTGFAGPQVAPPWGGSAEGDAGGTP
jgi:hypothetical protein